MVNYKINVYLKHTEMENMYVREFIELVTQDINGNNFEFTVYEDDNVYDLTNKRVTMVVKSDSGTVIQENCQVVDAKRGKATITLPPDMLIENGPYMAEVQIWEGVNSRVTTLPFDYTVRLSLENDESIKADPRFSLLQVALQNVNDADGKSKEALKLSKEAKAICDDLVPKANTAAQNAQEALDRAESVVTQEELAQKVMLDGKDTKFDFIENKVVQDGLVGNDSIVTENTSVLFKYSYNPEDERYLLTCFKANNSKLYGFGIYRRKSTNSMVFYIGTGISDSPNVVDTGLDNPSGEFFIAINNKDITYMSEEGTFNIPYSVSHLDVSYAVAFVTDADVSVYFKALYNKQLTPQEIQHNFSVLNNQPSIKELHTTDSTGKTSILPTLYKESKKARGTLIEIPYDEPRDLENYIYKFI